MAESPRWPGPRWGGPQRRIGLTGGIATGKSTVGQLLQERHGLAVLDADLFARQALAPGTEGARVVLERYGTLDRPALAHIVFGDPAERHWLEQLVHPLVRQRFDQELTTLAEEPLGAGQPAVVLMIPLLFEAGLEGLCSEVWLVDCDEAQQLARLMARNGLNQAEAQGRINAQWPLERKRLLADRTISNRGTAAALEAQIQSLLSRSDPCGPGTTW
jgi:dephospho-CoA kinase